MPRLQELIAKIKQASQKGTRAPVDNQSIADAVNELKDLNEWPSHIAPLFNALSLLLQRAENNAFQGQDQDLLNNLINALANALTNANSQNGLVNVNVQSNDLNQNINSQIQNLQSQQQQQQQAQEQILAQIKLIKLYLKKETRCRKDFDAHFGPVRA